MIDDWFRTVELKISFEEFERLPRTIGFKHEYYDGRCILTPRPRNCYAVLDLTRFRPLEPNSEMVIRPIEDRDWPCLGPLCAAACHRLPPFSSLTDQEKQAAGRDCMEHAHRGGDGPLLSAASTVAADEQDAVLAALLVVLKPLGYRDAPWRCHTWADGSVPDPAAGAGKAQAHLDWVFVSPWYAGHGIASAMLARSAAVLGELGYPSLTSAFLLGNGESMAWHWRNGFALLPNPASMREMRRRLRAGDP